MPPVRKSILSSFFLVASLALGADAQSPSMRVEPGPRLPVSPLSIIGDAVGLSTTDGETWGIGPSYRARFWMDGPEFSGMESSPLRMKLVSIHRGGPSLPIGPARLSEDGLTAVYHRSDFDERYEIRKEGMEQSFVLRRLPQGTGDLLITLDVDTRLRRRLQEGAHAAGKPDLELRDSDGAGVRIGEVTVIDARGQTAALPLVVDPLFGSVLDLRGTDGMDDVQVAYLPAKQRYLVAWTHDTATAIAVGRSSIVGQMVKEDGSRDGPIRAISTGSNHHVRLRRLATVESQDAFVAFYDSRRLSSLTQPSGDFVVKARAISAAWNMGDPITVQSSSFGDCFGQDLAGSTGEDDSAYATWRAPNGNGAVELRVGRIRVDSDMKVGNFGQIAISTGTDTSFGGGGSIARTGGPTGRYLIAWTKDNSIRGTVIGPGLARLGGSFAIQTFDGEFRTAPKVDGDGTSWLVAYSRSEGNSRSSYDAVCRRVTFDEPRGRAHVEGDEIGVAQRAGFNEFCRDIARLGDSYLLVIEDHQAPVLLSLDPANCSRCEGRFRLDSSIRKSLPMAVATPQTGGSIPNRRRSLVVWADPDTDPNLRGQFFEEADGAIKNLGGGCGSAGENLASCARVARSAFSYRLRYADSNTTAFLMLGFEQITLSCGGCTMMVNPMASLRTTTDGWGSASVNVPVPNYPSLHGLEVLGQWAFIDQGRTCMDQIDVSDALSVRIEG